ncbi:hypothetical protein [Halostella litorea]|uniref:hypothetical protein n=1 Tax=Halostella litorea TaxID=2528831 RepID=UPI001091DD77|nr:hypothetical protein [Halostella litorea]
MIRAALARLWHRIREAVAVADPDERIEGSGEVYLDPAYNGRYEGERELQRLSNAEEDPEE